MRHRALLFFIALITLVAVPYMSWGIIEIVVKEGARGKSFSSSDARIHEVEEPQGEQFPLYFYVFLREDGLYEELSGNIFCVSTEKPVDIPLYYGILKIDKKYSVAFIQASNVENGAIGNNLNLITILSNMQSGVAGWNNLCAELYFLYAACGMTLVMAQPGDTPDADFIPDFVDSIRITSFEQLDRLAKEQREHPQNAVRIGKALRNARDGMRIIRFKKTWTDGTITITD